MEELIIRVKIDGFQGSEQGGGRDSGGSTQGAVAGLLAASTLSQENAVVSYKGQNAVNKVLNQFGKGVTFKSDPKENPQRTQQGFFSARWRVPGTFQSATNPDMLNGAAPQVRLFAGSQLNEYLESTFTPQRIASMGTAAAWKAVSAYSSIQQHRSGDSYYNQQLQNGIKLASYGVALAASGPFAPVVAAGIAINETVNAVVGAINFNYDRNMEGLQIRNIKFLAGDVSYGRNRGGI